MDGLQCGSSDDPMIPMNYPNMGWKIFLCWCVQPNNGCHAENTWWLSEWPQVLPWFSLDSTASMGIQEIADITHPSVYITKMLCISSKHSKKTNTAIPWGGQTPSDYQNS